MNKNLTIKLISPRMHLRPMDSEFKRVLSPSLSLITIASLTPKTHRVFIEDENVEKLNLQDQPDLVGINVNVDTSVRAIEIARAYRKRNIKVVLGGIHASANAGEMIQHCDAIVIGEAENVWETLLDDVAHENLQKFYHQELTDLSKIPLPDWNLINRNKYLYNNIITTSRGCPFKCNFCYNSSEYATHSFRNRPIENVVEEINQMGTKHVMFIDDNFIGNPKWTSELIKRIKPFGLTWHAAVSANIVHHKELIQAFAESGCRSLFIGFESINTASIQSAQKSQNKTHEYEELIGLLHAQGIMVNASFVFGFDHDEPNVFKNTLEWLVKNKVETMTAHILTPYPGTKLHEKLKAQKRIINDDLTKYNTANVVFQPEKMTADELLQGYFWMYDQFYSFKNILKRKPDNPQIVVPYLLFNLGYRKFGKFFSQIGKAGLMRKIGKFGRKLSYSVD